MDMSIDEMVGAVDQLARQDAAAWLGCLNHDPSADVVAAAAEDYADYRFPERLADAETPAWRETYQIIFRCAACPPGEWQYSSCAPNEND